MAETLYDVLGLNKTATKEEIKKAYRNLSKQHHPDVGGDEEVFKKISHAYNILSDDDKRKNYDNHGSEKNQRFNPFAGNPFTNIRMRPRPINIELRLTVEEVYKVEKPCSTCNGVGATETKRCDVCEGKGAIIHQIQNMQHITMCTTCNGSGIIPIKKCNTCNGIGRQLVSENHDIDIPKGVTEGNTLILEGFGNQNTAGYRGDVFLLIKVEPHPVYTIEGLDISKKEELPFIDMVLGCNYELETLGGKFKITIPESCESNKIFRLKGQGIKDENSGRVGDLYVKVIPKIPKELTTEEKNTLLSLKNFSNKFS
jgi:molecular chaperone DnaJ